MSENGVVFTDEDGDVRYVEIDDEEYPTVGIEDANKV